MCRTKRREHFSARVISRTPRPAASSRLISSYRSTVNFLRDIVALPLVIWRRTYWAPGPAAKSAAGSPAFPRWWAQSQEIGWGQYQEIRWVLSRETGWVPCEEIVQSGSVCAYNLCPQLAAPESKGRSWRPRVLRGAEASSGLAIGRVLPGGTCSFHDLLTSGAGKQLPAPVPFA